MSACTMHDTYAGHGDVAEYVAEDGHEFVEIWQRDIRKKTGERKVRAGKLNHANISSWLKQPSQVKDDICSFRLFISKPVNSVAPGRRRLPLTIPALKEIVKAFNIPLPYVNLSAAHTTIALDFDDPVQHDALPSGAALQPTGIICILGPISFTVSYNTATKITTGMIMGLCDHQAINLVANIHKSPDAALVPMLLPALILNILSETRAHRVLGRKQAINSIEVEIGVHWGVQTDLGPRKINLEEATRRLTMYGSEVAWDVHAIEAQLEMVALIEQVQESMNDQNDSLNARHREAFRARTRRIRQVLSGLMHWTRYNQQRIQVQLQIIYSFVSQRDNEISYRTAVASQKIAEAAQRDGVLMKQLAAQSKALALRTWRDGVDMRAMALVTLVTLPGTFTATFFSTSFFDFQPAGDGTRVSSWIWLYFVVTAAFTALCLCGWYYSSRKITQAAEKYSAEEGNMEEEKTLDRDPLSNPHATKINLGKEAISLRLPKNLIIPPEKEDLTLDGRMIGSATNCHEPAPARVFWDASDIWGTQSYKPSGRACAMCACFI